MFISCFRFSLKANTGKPAQITDAMVCAGFEYSQACVILFDAFFKILRVSFSKCVATADMMPAKVTPVDLWFITIIRQTRGCFME